MPIAKVNNIDLWYETFGSVNNTPLLLIMGGCCQGIMWPKEFCELLAKRDFFVIRYDHRDTGLSSAFDYKKNPYNIYDMAADAKGLLDFLTIKQAHLVGLSLGGPIAEILAIHHKEIIKSITLIATSCEFKPMNLGYSNQVSMREVLSGPKQVYLDWMHKFIQNWPQDTASLIKFRMEGWSILSGNATLNIEEEYRLQRSFVFRQKDMSSIFNHLQVVNSIENIVRELPAQVEVPTLVLHGTEDAVFPEPHGQLLASKIKEAKYFSIKGMGHVIHKDYFLPIIDNISALAFRKMRRSKI